MKGARILTSGELCTGLPTASSTRSLGLCQVRVMMGEWSSLSEERPGTGSGVPVIGVTGYQNFPIFLFAGAHSDPR